MAVGLFKTLKDTIFPLSCVGCQRDGELLCTVCRAGFVFRNTQHCPVCEAPTVYGSTCAEHVGGDLDGVVALGWYANPQLQTLIRQWKYGYVREAEPVIERLVSVWMNQTQQLPTGEWVVVPVPLHPIRERQRGFNQASILSRMVSDELGIPMDTLILIRTRHVLKAQAKMEDKTKRAANHLDHFRVDGQAPRQVILVDDVYTTGKTMQACARVLKRAGAQTVWGCVLARGD
ncbi:hypothetical protein COV06_04385 [Candidatus Uhrbacteria bacterium CG10_big_fil_rev_8_21_14_0_10_50_16]|uniref:Phosphoribosyltransferase domain-containing protein n=1 Tax=Candidatus Uhrbacteria bacterium CG10_big_fil_rev_8_21_14_0_10_50_16 TaxID=1975039 RepID=A0A2H0RLB8_9BACT|nr:MAG: hypothetical protein COV06_04385 [Candidatus Uhrbacteria bacterium CG10_big_fil_rev_8_21_14_0_10_50_16]